MRATVIVRLQDTVADSAGTAVSGRLQDMGFSEVEKIRLGRVIEIEIDSSDKESVKGRVDRMCNRMLINPEFEEYELFLHD